jgi:integrase/recombinase XerD
MSYNPIVVTLTSLNPFFFNGLKKELGFSDNAWRKRPRNPIRAAKIVSPTQERAILGYLVTTRYPAWDRVLFLLSMKAGLHAKAMASLTWALVTAAAGQVAEARHVPHRARKGTTGGRTIPLHPDLQAALVTLQAERGDMVSPERPIRCSERGGGLALATVRLRFHRFSLSPYQPRHGATL